MEPTPIDPDAVADGSAEPVPARRGRLPLVLGVAAAIVLVDLVSKLVVVARLEGNDPIPLLWGLITLHATRNPGAAFSIGTGMTFVFSIVAVVVVVVVVRQARRLQSTAWALTFGALLGGALGNMICRVFRSPGPFRGYVVDWIEFPHFPIFNVADAAITVAGVSIAVLTFRGVPFEGRGDSRG